MLVITRPPFVPGRLFPDKFVVSQRRTECVISIESQPFNVILLATTRLLRSTQFRSALHIVCVRIWTFQFNQFQNRTHFTSLACTFCLSWTLIRYGLKCLKIFTHEVPFAERADPATKQRKCWTFDISHVSTFLLSAACYSIFIYIDGREEREYRMQFQCPQSRLSH